MVDEIRGSNSNSINSSDVCPIEQTCDSSNSFNSYYGFLIAGQCLNGIGGQAIWAFGPVYIDENLSKTAAPFALGLLGVSAALGGALGFVFAGAFLDLWVDGASNAPNGMTPDDDLWVGNWWACFVIAGVGSVVIGILIASLPKELAVRSN